MRLLSNKSARQQSIQLHQLYTRNDGKMCRVIDGYFISLRKAWLLRKIGKQQLATSVLA